MLSANRQITEAKAHTHTSQLKGNRIQWKEKNCSITHYEGYLLLKSAFLTVVVWMQSQFNACAIATATATTKKSDNNIKRWMSELLAMIVCVHTHTKCHVAMIIFHIKIFISSRIALTLHNRNFIHSRAQAHKHPQTVKVATKGFFLQTERNIIKMSPPYEFQIIFVIP